MRIKTFTLMTLALLVSAVSFAQKPITDVSIMASKMLVSNRLTPASGIGADARDINVPIVGAHRAAEVVTPPAGDVEYFTAKGTAYTYGSSGWTEKTYDRTVKVIWDADDVYICGLSYYNQDSWLKGTFTDETNVVFAMGQYQGNGAGADIYCCAQDENRVYGDMIASYNGETNTFTFTTIIADCVSATGGGMYAYVDAGLEVAPAGDDVDIPVEAPTDLETEEWSYSGVDRNNNEFSKVVKVGFYGDEVYIQGFCQYLPNAWVKGTKDGNIITFEDAQYYGQYAGVYDFYFRGVSNESWSDVVFTYDEDSHKMSTEAQIRLFGIYNGNGGSYETNTNVVIAKVIETAATPATPSIPNMRWMGNSGDGVNISIPTIDVEGNGLVADKLSYKLYYEDNEGNINPVVFTTTLYTKLETDFAEVPYGYSDNYDFYANYLYLNMDFNNWKKVGIQSVYRGGGEENASEIGWHTIQWPVTVTLPEGLTITENEFSGTRVDDETYEDVEFTKSVNVAVDGDNIYIQGFGEADGFAESWVKGVKTADNIYTIDLGQMLGKTTSSTLFLMGMGNSPEPAKLKIDTANGVYILANDFIINGRMINQSSWWTWYNANSTIAINGTPTGIETVKANVDAIANGAMFNLAGQRVAESYKGLVIKNGKKYVVK